MSTRRILPLAALLTASALLLSGCFPFTFPSGGGGSQTVDTSTDEEVEPGLEAFYQQELTWYDLGNRVDETTVTVPLDWDDPAGETIEIAIARHNATGEPMGSMLMNPGGPGGSGYDFVAYSAAYIVTEDVLAGYDIIGFDPRGVGQSSPIVCTDGAEKDELLYGTFDADYGTQAWIDELTVRETDWIDACVENTGDLLGNLDAASVARDMDVIRAVLGDEKLTFLGYSYGTYLGAVYAELFPEKVGRMVLDGAVDPLVGDLDALATQMAGFESAYRSFLEYCFDSSDCPFSGSVESAMQQTENLILDVGDDGLTSNDGRVLDVATIGTGLINNLYAEFLWSGLVQMLADLDAGDAQSTFDSADEYNSRVASGIYDGNGYEIYTAVTCNEGTLGTDGVTPLEGLAVIDQRAPYLGFATALDDYVALDVTCSNWPFPVAEMPAQYDAEGAPPILVVGTTNDPATPYAQAVSLAQQLSSGVLITYDGEGHTIYAQGVSCVDDAVDAYFLRGDVPSADPMC
ncbi:alpha/beta hydrolase [Pseudolysinimonas yzui]|uniref:Alpha/beta hydrolase n=1 Tax=Pseudolysinimonas yzui TaxID=2708254 RepID=A0A8J3GRN7_9MICO|nr:alpha/beta hydrolase [Pseudolysinimonas yzui]GHF20185.1 alpha/beta hydrolase [Pseudolysinimonas yzui]